jgi:hypothetical protein
VRGGAVYLAARFTTTPPFTTVSTCDSAVTSKSESPLTTMTSAPADPATLGAASGVLVLVAALFLPARRAAGGRPGPFDVLRPDSSRTSRRAAPELTCAEMSYEGEERRFARWICAECQSPRYAPIPPDGRLKCPICYTIVPFEPRRHSRRDPADRGRAPEEIPPQR